MSGGDQALENLRAFCELLRVTNPVIEGGASDLDRLGHGLKDAATKLSEELHHLASDVDGLQQEAQTSEAAAVKACEDLGHVADDVKGTGLSEVEKGAASTQQHWTDALHQASSELDGAFQELASQGWEPLGEELTNEQGDFDQWTHKADEIFQGLAHSFGTVEQGVAHQGTVLDEATRDLEAAPPFSDPYWFGVGSHARAITEQTIPQYGEHVVKQVQELTGVDDQLVAEAEQGSTHVRAQVDLTAQTAVTTIDEKDVELMKAVEAAAEGLKNAQIEFERGAIQAEAAQAQGHELAELGGHVAEAETQLQQVQAALEALGQ